MAEHATATEPLAHAEGAVLAPTLHHINLKTVRLREMIDWYAKVLGMQVYFQYQGGAWLSNDAANHRPALLTSPAMSDDPGKITHTGMHHCAFEFGDTVDDLPGT